MTINNLIDNVAIIGNAMLGARQELRDKGVCVISFSVYRDGVEVHVDEIIKLADILLETLQFGSPNDFGGRWVRASFERMGVEFFGLVTPEEAEMYKEAKQR